MQNEDHKPAETSIDTTQVSKELLLPKDDQRTKKHSKSEKKALVGIICFLAFLSKTAYSFSAYCQPKESG